jgi:hypothetical protein
MRARPRWPAFLHPVAVIDAGSASVGIRIDDLLISLTRLAPAGIYVATTPFVAGIDGGSGHLTSFDPILAIVELLVHWDQMPRFESLIRKLLWKVPFAALS